MAEPQGARECANAEQAAEWDGPAGAHRTKYAAVFDAPARCPAKAARGEEA